MTNRFRLSILWFLGLMLLAGSTAVPARTLTASAIPTPSWAHVLHGKTTSTPAAPVSSKGLPSTSEEDIRDIRQPRHIPCHWPWVAAVAGVLAFCTAGFLVRKRVRQRISGTMLPPYRLALQALERARLLINADYAREYCFTVSQIIRDYLEAQFRLRAPRLTTEEFLRELVETSETVLASHSVALGEFLGHCDLAKFAGWRCSVPELEAMHASAKAFLQQTGRDPILPRAKCGRLGFQTRQTTHSNTLKQTTL